MSHLVPTPGADRRSGEGLLASIADNALDDDYYAVRRDDDTKSHGVRSVISALAVFLFALMVTIAAVQARTNRPGNQLERNALIADIGVRKNRLADHRSEAEGLAAKVDSLQKSSSGTNPEAMAMRVLTAEVAATGPGIEIVIDDSESSKGERRTQVSERDLQILINGLWYAGAEAISINGNRLSTQSAIGSSNRSLNVNYRSLTRPYRIVALGNSEQLEQRITTNAAGQYWAQRRHAGGLRFDLSTSDHLSVPAAPAKRTEITHASPIEGEE